MDAGIIRSFKLKYRKLLIRYVISKVDDKQASNIINEINILKVIGWVKSAWKEFTSDTMKHCFEKCGFPTDDYVATAQDSDDEFEMLFNEIVLLTNILRQITPQQHPKELMEVKLTGGKNCEMSASKKC